MHWVWSIRWKVFRGKNGATEGEGGRQQGGEGFHIKFLFFSTLLFPSNYWKSSFPLVPKISMNLQTEGFHVLFSSNQERV